MAQLDAKGVTRTALEPCSYANTSWCAVTTLRAPFALPFLHVGLVEPHARATVIILVDEDDAGGFERLADCGKVVRRRGPARFELGDVG